MKERQKEKELPTCPPVSESSADDSIERYAYEYPAQGKVLGEQDEFKLNTLHHAAVFAPTRWSNLYFPAIGGLFGDFVGGKMKPVFGAGVLDLPVRSQFYFGIGNYTLLAHQRYWKMPKIFPSPEETALEELIDKLDLDSDLFFKSDEQIPS